MKDKIVEDLKREFDIRSCVGIDRQIQNNTTRQ